MASLKCGDHDLWQNESPAVRQPEDGAIEHFVIFTADNANRFALDRFCPPNP
jgi:hypothetical protein